jgi:galactokinase
MNVAQRNAARWNAAQWYPAPSDDRAAAQAQSEFAAAHGHPADGVWAAPGRVNLIGEHVDYNGGLCLPMALPHKAFVALGLAGEDRADEITLVSSGNPTPWRGSAASLRPGAVLGWGAYLAGVPWALGVAGGFQAAVVSQVPSGAGLSSSAALECSVAVAFDELCGLGLASSDAGRAQLAKACVRAENEIAGAPTGGMDQAASLRAVHGHALLLDCTDFSLTQVPFDAGAAGLAVLVIDTRVHHSLADGQYGSRRQACDRAAALLGVDALGELDAADLDDALARLPDSSSEELRRRVRHVVTEIGRVREAAALLAGGRLHELGPLLDASHASLRDDYEVSCTELDVACATAREAGALGARMTGGGFGGSAIALVEEGAAEGVADEVAQAFSRNGFGPPKFLIAQPSGSARRVL